MPALRLFYANVTLHWGFVVRTPGATATQPALALAPPTTVVGAFAASLLRALGFSEGGMSRRAVSKSKMGRKALDGEAVLSPAFWSILDSTIAASMGLHLRNEGPGVGVVMEVSRILAAPYKTGGEIKRMKAEPYTLEFYMEAVTRALPVQAVGVAYAPSTVVDLVWVVDVEKLVRGFSEEGVQVSDIDAVGLAAAYGVTRLGSKEGICSVNAACYIEDPPLVDASRPFQAHTYVPVECVVPRNASLVSKIRLWDLKYKPADYYAPRDTTIMLAYPPVTEHDIPYYNLKDNCVAYRIDRIEQGKCIVTDELKSIESVVAVGMIGEAR